MSYNSKRFFCESKQILLLLTFLLCAFFGYLLYGIFSLPNTVYVAEGSTASLKVNLPLDTALTPEAIPVIASSDTPATDNIRKNTDGSISVDTSETGESSLKLSFLGVTVKDVKVNVIPEMEVVPCGKTIGVEINTKGLMVLGTGSVSGADGQTYNPADGILNSGDTIIKANGVDLANTDDLVNIISQSAEKVDLTVRRDYSTLTVGITPVKDKNGENKLGVWLRDGTEGIGTMTYYNSESGNFGALGHGITDVDTKKLIVVNNGKIMDSYITTVKKGKKGSPGELVGEIRKSETLGEIKANTSLGLYGKVSDSEMLPQADKKVKIGLQNEVHLGPAVILSNVSGSEVREYDVYIESTNKLSSDESKGIVIRITDQALLSKTNGIVQGMSGSPILQDGKLIGAITHVFVQNPAKGYGIFIENMIKQEDKIN